MNRLYIPELLAPAGSLDKLYSAFTYGADAVYIGGPQFGLRHRAGNFTLEDIAIGCDFAHSRQKKVYVVMNIFPWNDDFNGLDEYLRHLCEVGVDAVIVSDPVLQRKAHEVGLVTHISTQASCVNSAEAQFWGARGASRIVPGRELSIEAAAELATRSGVEIEMFVHGSLCMSFSGKCLISNFTTGRDANRGGCVQSCRWGYQVVQRDGLLSESLCHPLNSLDLMGLRLLPMFCKAGIHSLKIEGRMKSNLYLAAVISSYRQALDALACGAPVAWEKLEKRIAMVSNRGFTQGSLVAPAARESVALERSGYHVAVEYIGDIVSVHDGRGLLVVRKSARSQHCLSALLPDGTVFPVGILTTLDGEPVDHASPGSGVVVSGMSQPHVVVYREL